MGDSQLTEEALDELMAEDSRSAPCSPDWIASTERLPDSERRVMMCKHGTLTVGHWNSEVGAWYGGCGGNYEGPDDALAIRFWAELPAPPPGEEFDHED